MVVVEERVRRGWKNRHMRDNIPCREASAVKLAPDHTSKLDAVLVDPCFIQCWREVKRKGGGGRERSKERSKDRKEERESPPPPLPLPLRAHVQHASVCSFKTPSCEATRPPHVEHMRASCGYTRRRFESTHGGVLDMNTGGFSAHQAVPHPTHSHTHTPNHTHTHHTEHQTQPHTNNHTHAPPTQPHVHDNTPTRHNTTQLHVHTHHTYHTTHHTPDTTSCQCHF